MASASILGAAGQRPSSPPNDAAVPPLEALQRAVLPALRDPPCVVSFSGGRDSSLVLATATRAARAAGLPPPIPVSLRFPGAEKTFESSWQERVVRHLGLTEWERLEFSDELDLVGPIAATVLERHGPVYPPNVHLHDPICKLAGGGSVLTGWGGDDLFVWIWGRALAVLHGQARPAPRDVLRIAHFAAPARVRILRERRRVLGMPLPWLRPAANRAIVDAIAAHQRDHPRRWNRYLAWLSRRRYVAMTRQGLERVAEANGCTIDHPLLDAGFLSALARAGGRRGWSDRTAAFLDLFSDVLPDDVCRRTDKAWFDVPFWSTHSREFIARWDGSGVDHELVFPEPLRETWNESEPDMRSSLLLQSAWLAERRADGVAAGV